MDLCDSLIKWMKMFGIEKQINSHEDLTDGVILAHILNQISPSFFSSIWLSKIKPDAGNNWRLKVSNLKKLVKGIQDYYSQEIHDAQLPEPDITAIVERSDAKELGVLLQLILVCAFHSENKHVYIKQIMGMEESVQLSIMQAYQELTSKESHVHSAEARTEINDQVKKSAEEIRRLTEERDAYAQRCHDFDQQVVVLLEEKSNLQTEVERINERLNQAESLEDPNNWNDWPKFLLSTPAGRRYQLLQRQAEQLQEDFYRSETAKDDFRLKCEELEREVFDLQQKNDKLTSLTEEARNIKDEVDVLRHKAEKAGKLEATVETLKRKLEEMSDLKAKVKLVEESNTTYVQQNMELEEEVKRNNVFKAQVDIYKKQLQEVQSKCAEETKRADKAEFEGKRAQEKLVAMQHEKERLTEERDSLKEINEELNCLQLQPKAGSYDTPDSISSDLELMSLSSTMRAQFLRLQHENKMLKVQAVSSGDDQILKSMLEDSNTKIHEQECEIRRLNQKIMELEASVEDMDELRQKISSEGDNASSELKRRLREQLDKCQKYETELQVHKNQCETLEAKLQTNSDEVQELTETLKRKDGEMKEMEEKYKKYLSRTREVIKQLDPKHNPQGSDIQALKAQLNEKEKYLQTVQQESDRARTTREAEEKLMTTAWFNLCNGLSRKSVDDRLSLNNIGQQSFLSRQRQAHVRRTPGGTPGGTNVTSSMR